MVDAHVPAPAGCQRAQSEFPTLLAPAKGAGPSGRLHISHNHFEIGVNLIALPFAKELFETIAERGGSFTG